MTSPFPFVAGATLTAAQLNSIGEWTDYTATHVNTTFSSVTSKFATVNEFAIVLFDGTISSVTGTIAIRLPTAAPASESLAPAEALGIAQAIDASASQSYIGLPEVDGGNDWVKLANAGVPATVGNWSAVAPFSWASGDSLRFSVIYRIAPS